MKRGLILILSLSTAIAVTGCRQKSVVRRVDEGNYTQATAQKNPTVTKPITTDGNGGNAGNTRKLIDITKAQVTNNVTSATTKAIENKETTAIEETSNTTSTVTSTKPSEQNTTANKETKPVVTKAIEVPKITINEDVDIFATSQDALDNSNPVSKYSKGEYFVKKEENGAINISSSKDSLGGWINPLNNVKIEADSTGQDRKLINFVTSIDVYNSSDDAKSRSNMVTTWPAGRYIVYDENNGMVNITSDPNSEGAWINPGSGYKQGMPEIKTTTSTTTTKPTRRISLSKPTKVYGSSSDATNMVNEINTYAPGEYFVYKEDGEVLNISTSEGKPGAWYNPNQKEETTTTQSTTTTKEIEKTTIENKTTKPNTKATTKEKPTTTVEKTTTTEEPTTTVEKTTTTEEPTTVEKTTTTEEPTTTVEKTTTTEEPTTVEKTTTTEEPTTTVEKTTTTEEPTTVEKTTTTEEPTTTVEKTTTKEEPETTIEKTTTTKEQEETTVENKTTKPNTKATTKAINGNNSDNPSNISTNKVLIEDIVNVYETAEDAENGNNPIKTYEPGEYFVYKESGGAINISTTSGEVGGWINKSVSSPLTQNNVSETTSEETTVTTKVINEDAKTTSSTSTTVENKTTQPKSTKTDSNEITNIPKVGEKYTITSSLEVYGTSEDAINGTNPIKTYEKDSYFVYKIEGNSINISKVKGEPGGWIYFDKESAAHSNIKTTMEEKKDEPTTTTKQELTSSSKEGDIIVLSGDTFVYGTSEEAKDGTGEGKIYAEGQYYVYKVSDGMYNISKVNGEPGGWVNPTNPTIEEKRKPTFKLEAYKGQGFSVGVPNTWSKPAEEENSVSFNQKNFSINIETLDEAKNPKEVIKEITGTPGEATKAVSGALEVAKLSTEGTNYIAYKLKDKTIILSITELGNLTTEDKKEIEAFTSSLKF